MPKLEVFTTGFPRTGNTWLDRLLSDLLSAPLQTKPKEVIEYFGIKRNGNFMVRKTHWYASQYSGKGYAGKPSKMIWIQRDPRDMAVSMMYYGGAFPDLMRVLKGICLGGKTHPEIPLVGYRGFVEGWLEHGGYDYMTKYELLHTDPITELMAMYFAITGKLCTKEWAKEVNNRQVFAKHAPKYEHSMRKGKTGDYKLHFKQVDGKFMSDTVGDIMLSQGYIDDLDWWKELPK